VIAAGFGAVNPVQVFWATVVLGIRPAAYLFRHAEQILDLEVVLDYVRTARAKGLPWRKVVTHHVVRGALPSILAAWMKSFRLMIGCLPLVEYFFGYLGLGRVLVLSMGVAPGLDAQVHNDLAVGLVVTMALILVAVEAVIGFAQRRVDPRLSESAMVAA
jgi:ABC-type dipeptide/oligopeptide/nickel transport system permease component